ncbi:hypothetical protein [Phytohabitans kaempferiae]|uniref:Uncharacterized protein n=1 Tax=Phytohabitans kaempferiae TaxID=1620943 RepID=A0ABV6MHP9_9ACTN
MEARDPMGDTDPHIHVERGVLRASAAVREVLASSFGLVGDAPTVVTTGCGRQVPFAMTSGRPESVTCLACREHGHREHERFADEVERLSRMPGITIDRDDAAEAARRHRDLAKRFAA